MSEGSPNNDDSPAPKKKAARRRRKKKPVEGTGAAEQTTGPDQKKPEPKRPAPTRDSRRKKRPVPPEKPKRGGALEQVPPVAAGPARGRRTGLAASGKPRKGRSSASIQPPAPVTPSHTRKPPRPKPTPSARTEGPATSAPRSSRKDTDDKVPSKKPEGKRPERKKPIAKTRPTDAKAEREQQPKKAAGKPPREAQPPRKRETADRTEEKPRRRKRKPAARPVEPQPDVAAAQVAPAEAGPTAEVRGEPKRRKKRKKASDGERRPAERRPAEPTVVAPADAEPSAERHAEPTRKKRRKKAPDSEREPAKGRPVQPQEDVAPAEAISAEADRRSEPKRKEAQKKSRDVEQKPKRDRGQLPAFGSLALSDDMLEALAEAGYEEPTPVQAGLIPKALEGHDLMGQARTGTGKTAAFGIPLLERFGSGEKRKETAALILVPTRELAVQVRDELTKLAGRSRVTTVAVYGGKPIRGQIEHLRRGAEIVVGTPGRVIDLIDRRALNLAALECVVLDEADRMLDIGFRPDIEKILRRCPQARQTLLLSATIPPPVKRLAERYMHEPEMLDFSPQDVAVETIEQFYFTVDPRQKFDLLMKLIEREDPKQAIVFCRTKKGTDRVGTRLGRKLKGAAMIHGDLQQRQRDRVMADFRAGKIRFLAATDVVGRGIDVSGISHIINFDIPQFCDDYIHRVGRTGRMGREGVAYTFVSPEEGNELTRIEIRINRLLIRDEIPGFLAIPRPEPTEELDKPEGEQPKPKPVFGKRTRRIRRAL